MTYTVSDWLEKNNDKLNFRVIELLKNSSNPVMRHLWSGNAPASQFTSASTIARYLLSQVSSAEGSLLKPGSSLLPV